VELHDLARETLEQLVRQAREDGHVTQEAGAAHGGLAAIGGNTRRLFVDDGERVSHRPCVRATALTDDGPCLS
jgi:hypothetical protein